MAPDGASVARSYCGQKRSAAVALIHFPNECGDFPSATCQERCTSLACFCSESDNSCSRSNVPILVDSETDCNLEDFSEELMQLLEDTPCSQNSQSLHRQAATSSSRPMSAQKAQVATPSILERNSSRSSATDEPTDDVMRPTKEFIGPKNVKRIERAPVVSTSVKDNHIIRERLRRDDMSSKFAILESLLPWRSKRDRTAILDDALQFLLKLQENVKQLERQVQVCKKRQHNSHDEAATNGTSYSVIPSNDNGLSISSCRGSGPCGAKAIRETLTGAIKLIHKHSSLAVGKTPVDETRSVSETKVQAFTHAEEIIIHITSSSRPQFLISLMRAIDDLHLDVIDCNYCKTPPELLCIIVAKIQPGYPADPAMFTTHLVSSLECALHSRIGVELKTNV